MPLMPGIHPAMPFTPGRFPPILPPAVAQPAVTPFPFGYKPGFPINPMNPIIGIPPKKISPAAPVLPSIPLPSSSWIPKMYPTPIKVLPVNPGSMAIPGKYKALISTLSGLIPKPKPLPPPPKCSVDVKAISGHFMAGRTWGFGLRGELAAHVRPGKILDLSAIGKPGGGKYKWQFTVPSSGFGVTTGMSGRASFLSNKSGTYKAIVTYYAPNGGVCQKTITILVR